MKRLLLTLLVLAAANAFGANSVVLLPLDNVSGDQSAASDLPPLIAKALAAKGWTVVAGDEIETLLETERVRYLDSLDADTRAKVLRKSGATAILTVTVYTWTQGRNPTVALSAHLIGGDGQTLWSNLAAVASSDTERILGLGKKENVKSVAETAVDQLMRGFGTARRGSRSRSSAAHYVSDELDPSRHVCVVPFDNSSSSSDAPRILADTLAMRLEAAGFTVIDPAVLRAAALKAHVSLHNAGSQELAALARIIGTPLFLRGTIFAFDAAPAIDVEATLVDVSTSKVLWAAQQTRKGTDYTGFLMLGAVSNSVALTDRVATELIATARTNHAHKHAPGDRTAVAANRRRQLHAGEGQR